MGVVIASAECIGADHDWCNSLSPVVVNFEALLISCGSSPTIEWPASLSVKLANKATK